MARTGHCLKELRANPAMSPTSAPNGGGGGAGGGQDGGAAPVSSQVHDPMQSARVRSNPLDPSHDEGIRASHSAMQRPPEVPVGGGDGSVPDGGAVPDGGGGDGEGGGGDGGGGGQDSGSAPASSQVHCPVHANSLHPSQDEGIRASHSAMQRPPGGAVPESALPPPAPPPPAPPPALDSATQLNSQNDPNSQLVAVQEVPGQIPSQIPSSVPDFLVHVLV